MAGRQSTKRLPGLPLIAAGTDIPGGAPVQIVSSGGAFGVRPVATNAEGPIIGVARASAINGDGVDIIDTKDIRTAVAAASIAQGAFIGVASASAVTGASGSIQQPQIAEVARASASNRYTLGIALEGAAKGSSFSYYFDPKQLSGLI
jgi:hypothetical protein